MPKQSKKIACDDYCGIRLPQEHTNQLDFIARAKGIKRSKLIRQAIELYLEKATAA